MGRRRDTGNNANPYHEICEREYQRAARRFFRVLHRERKVQGVPLPHTRIQDVHTREDASLISCIFIQYIACSSRRKCVIITLDTEVHLRTNMYGICTCTRNVYQINTSTDTHSVLHRLPHARVSSTLYKNSASIARTRTYKGVI